MPSTRNNSATPLPMNINITSQNDNDNDNDNKFNEFKDYIIKTNISLQEKNNELQLTVLEQTNTIREKEEEIDNQDERIRYMRGLLQNLALINEKRSKLSESWEIYAKKYSKIINKYYDSKNINLVFNINIYILIILFLLDNLFNKNSPNYLLFYYISYQIISIIFIISYIKIIKQEKFQFKYEYFKNFQLLKFDFKENLKHLSDEQTLRIEANAEIKKSIEDIESGCVSVNVMIDNI